MNEPLVSVIIPAYQQANFLGEAIRSVLDQTYGNLEVIVVDDHSPDNTAAVVQQFADRRLHYIAHEQNRMLAAARNTGLRASHGDMIALLDADDYFVSKKLAMHVEFLRHNPGVGISYNGRYDLRCSNQNIRNIVRVPAKVSLGDLVLGFPFTPSDMVLRRAAAFAIDLFDESFIHFSEDLDFNCRLALAGWQFAGLDRCLTCRRFHGGRIIHNPRQRLAGALRSLDQTFSDSRIPQEVLGLKERAYANHYIVWGVEALRGGDTASGVEFLRQALRLVPELLRGSPCELTRFLVYEAAHNDTEDHSQVYRDVLAQLPDEFEPVKRQAEWGIGRAWLVSAYRYLLWSSVQDARHCLAEAERWNARYDESYVREVVYQLLGLERERGRQAADEAARHMDEQFAAVFNRPAHGLPGGSNFTAALQMGRVIEYYKVGRHRNVPLQVLRAIRSSPQRALNRASLFMLASSAIQSCYPLSTAASSLQAE